MARLQVGCLIAVLVSVFPLCSTTRMTREVVDEKSGNLSEFFDETPPHLHSSITAAPPTIKCPERLPLRHLCGLCKVTVYSMKYFIKQSPLQKGMIETCSVVLHPHSLLCKAAMKFFFLVARKTPHERIPEGLRGSRKNSGIVLKCQICQHMLICEFKKLQKQGKPQNSSTPVDAETEALKLFDEGDGNFDHSYSILNENQRLDAMARLFHYITAAAGYPEFIQEIGPDHLRHITNKFFRAVEYYHMATMV